MFISRYCIKLTSTIKQNVLNSYPTFVTNINNTKPQFNISQDEKPVPEMMKRLSRKPVRLGSFVEENNETSWSQSSQQSLPRSEEDVQNSSSSQRLLTWQTHNEAIQFVSVGQDKNPPNCITAIQSHVVPGQLGAMVLLYIEIGRIIANYYPLEDSGRLVFRTSKNKPHHKEAHCFSCEQGDFDWILNPSNVLRLLNSYSLIKNTKSKRQNSKDRENCKLNFYYNRNDNKWGAELIAIEEIPPKTELLLAYEHVRE